MGAPSMDYQQQQMAQDMKHVQQAVEDIIINIPPSVVETASDNTAIIITAIIGGVVAIITTALPFILKRRKK